jgi:hypothetical protein
MTQDIEVLRAWIRVVILIAAIGSTSVPLVYSFSAWRERPIGRVMMLQAITFAAAIDMTALFSFWAPTNILVIFWVNVFVLSAIAISTSMLAYMVWSLNHHKGRAVAVLLTGKTYDLMKSIAQLYLPALGTLYFTVAAIWGLPSAEEVVGTIGAVDLFLGVILGISSSNYDKSPMKYDGTMAITNHDDGSTLDLKEVDLNALANKETLTFKVTRQQIEPVRE